MFVYYHDGEHVGTFGSKEDALLMVQAKLFKNLGPGPYDPRIFDGTDIILESYHQELDLSKEIGVIQGLINNSE